jgi:hypothetical protein
VNRVVLLLVALLFVLVGPARAQAPPGAACMSCGGELGEVYYASARGQWVCSRECGDALMAELEAGGAEVAAARAAKRAAEQAKADEAAAAEAATDRRTTIIMIVVPLLAVGALYGVSVMFSKKTPPPRPRGL